MPGDYLARGQGRMASVAKARVCPDRLGQGGFDNKMRSNRKRLVLHIGAHKTASSLLFRLLHRFSDELEQNGVRHVTRSRTLTSPLFDHLYGIASGSRAWDANLPEGAVAEVTELFGGPDQTVIVTSEDMFKRLALDKFYPNIGRALRLLKSLVPDRRLEVILYVRAQPGYVESCYVQYIQMGRSLEFEDFTGGGIPRNLNWYKTCKTIAKAIGGKSLTVRPYEIIKDLGPEGYFHDFLRAAGLDWLVGRPVAAEIESGSLSNRGYSSVAIDIARYAIPRIRKEDLPALRRLLQTRFSSDRYPRPRFFTDDEIRQMKDHYADSNRALFSEFIPGHDPMRLGYL